MAPKKNKFGNREDLVKAGVRAAVLHQRALKVLEEKQQIQDEKAASVIETSEALLNDLGYQLPDLKHPEKDLGDKQAQITLPSWDDVLAEAKEAIPQEIDVFSLLSTNEVALVINRHSRIGEELNWPGSLDRFDWTLSVAAGILAGALDVIWVGMPAHAGFLGSTASEGGALSNSAKNLTSQVFPPETVKELEKAFQVPYDPATNSQLGQVVGGLGPRTHRFQSLGHDPLLGFVFGVRDILNGDFTAIDKAGNLIIQNVSDAAVQGETTVERLLQAIITQLGHLASDVSTPAGLPAPLMPLLQFLKFGSIGSHGYTIGEIARLMYRSGYDLRHFAAASVPVLISELIVRIGYFARCIHDGKDLNESLPSASAPKLRRQLLVAHAVATLVNGGKVYVTQNPLAISWAQILTFIRYLVPEVGFIIFGAEVERTKLVNKASIAGYEQLLCDIDQTLASFGGCRLQV